MIEMTKKYAFKQSLPVMAGYLVLGMGFGILLKAKGYGVAWAFFMSLLIYAGSMQYVTINLLSGGATLLSASLMTLMVNARHLFYGISMTALFLVVFVDQWKSVKNHAGAVVGVGISVACLLIFGAERFLIPTMIAITVILTILRKKLDEQEMKKEKEKK